ncbi:hypothetical protein FisN_16Lh168 [Fistulifera solaris]|uniref:Uncharacterized protein n=1 Tax=Fistulifera solaris TaxID=1519565 RepID=A0A1Z5KJ78_FISSO|nr:hypothetical protein FisN_16Lh168 [Fistulifera solaris]|eukprot:GAX26329.1 hypothetical protein FisN_16Lh168 [Fistulifera solaris]
MTNMTHADDEFTAAFQGLAKHLFPDGCPYPSLELIWPHYDRTAAKWTDAINSYEQVIQYSLRNGLSSLQMHAMVVSVRAMLPPSKYKGPFATPSYFEKTVQAIIPREPIPPSALDELISGVTASEKGRSSVLQFLTLAVKYGCVEWHVLEQRFYSFFLHWSLQAETCNDAVRLLLLLSPRSRYATRLLSRKETSGSLLLLVELYTGVATQNHRLPFLNREWEQSFQRFHKPCSLVALQWSDLDYSWKTFQLSRVAKMKPSMTQSRSVLFERWWDVGTQKDLLEKWACVPTDLLVQRVLPLWDGRDADWFLHALPLHPQVLPYLERHFLFGSSAVQMAVGDYWMRLMQSGGDSEVVAMVQDLLLRALLLDLSSVVAFIAYDFLDKSTLPPDPTLLYLLGLSAVSWERFCQLIVRYKKEGRMDVSVLDKLVDHIRRILSGGPNLEDMCHRESVKRRLAALANRNNNSEDSHPWLPELAEAIQKDWPDANQFLTKIS